MLQPFTDSRQTTAQASDIETEPVKTALVEKVRNARQDFFFAKVTGCKVPLQSDTPSPLPHELTCKSETVMHVTSTLNQDYSHNYCWNDALLLT